MIAAPGMLMVFVAIVVTYHAGELICAWTWQRDAFSFASALLTPPYCAMMIFSVAEFLVESHYLPWLKQWPISLIGICVCIAGDATRKIAIVTARHAFTHQIATEHRAGHDLITCGIYRFSAHPGYFGWFWWAIGIQLILCDPLATVIGTIIAWRFFHDRIQGEEVLLRHFFGAAYDTYRRRTPSRIPFIA